MKKFLLVSIVMLLCCTTMFGQSRGRGHDIPCRECNWMVKGIHLYGKKSEAYYKIIHRYAYKIEREARKYKQDREKTSRRIYKFRVERDRKIRSLLSPSEYRTYLRFCRERPERIHDRRYWFQERSGHGRPNRPGRPNPWDDGCWYSNERS